MTIKRKTVRDGVIRAEVMYADLTEGDGRSDIAEIAEVWAASAPAQMIATYRASAEKVRDTVPDGSRHKYACNAIRQADEAAKYLQKSDTDSAVQHAIWMMEYIWRMDVKEVEPQIVTGARLRRASNRGNDLRKEAAAADRVKWQAIANKKWAINPSLKKADVAKLIDRVRWDYIRKQLAKPGEKT